MATAYRVGQRVTIQRPKKPFTVTVTYVGPNGLRGVDDRQRRWRIPYTWIAQLATQKKFIEKKRSTQHKVAGSQTMNAAGVSVTYLRFPAGLSAHPLPKINKAVATAIAKAHRAWQWAPNRLVISFKHMHSMGKAWCNTGEVALSTQLISEYDMKSVGRTVLHELAHLANNDKNPPRCQRRKFKGHDDSFCALLKAVDPLVRDQRTCRYFNDVAGA